MLYRNAKSCINTNGFLSSYFEITRSVRQGCPIAAFLYILQAEPMAEAIRKSKEVKGICLLGSNQKVFEPKIALFADDTQIFLSTDSSIRDTFKILKTYSLASGAKLNMKKTKGLLIGSWKDRKPDFQEIEWVKSVTGLGTEFGYGINYEDLWLRKFAKFKKQIKLWTKRDLSFRGKKLLINSYIISNISYLCDIYTANIPESFLTQTKDLIREFLWGGKTWRVAQKTTSLLKEHGGLDLTDITSFIQT